MAGRQIKLKVTVDQAHILRVSQCAPLDALLELIWNSFDAAATKVEVKIARNALGGLDTDMALPKRM